LLLFIFGEEFPKLKRITELIDGLDADADAERIERGIVFGAMRTQEEK
jgi:hypothetical protein